MERWYERGTEGEWSLGGSSGMSFFFSLSLLSCPILRSCSHQMILVFVGFSFELGQYCKARKPFREYYHSKLKW